METTPKFLKWIKIYAWFITLFTTLMVVMSLIMPKDFFESYKVTADIPFQTSWSFRYLTILIVMIAGILLKKPETLFITVLSRFLIDTFDGIAVGLYNTPAFSFGWLTFHLCVLIIPELFCLFTLAKLMRRT